MFVLGPLTGLKRQNDANDASSCAPETNKGTVC